MSSTRDPLVFDGASGRWRYLGRFISTEAGNAQARARIAHGEDIHYTDPSGERRVARPAEVVSLPEPAVPARAPAEDIHEVLTPPPDDFAPVPPPLPPSDIYSALEDILGEWSCEIAGDGAFECSHPGYSYEELIDRFRSAAEDPTLRPILSAVTRMHVSIRIRLTDGGYHWFSASFAVGGHAALAQAAFSLQKWAERYKRRGEPEEHEDDEDDEDIELDDDITDIVFAFP